MLNQVFKPATGANTNTLQATTTSQRRKLPTLSGQNVSFYNAGGSLAFINTGDNSVSAIIPTIDGISGNTGHTPLPVGSVLCFSLRGGDAYYSAITQAGTAIIYCTVGTGE